MPRPVEVSSRVGLRAVEYVEETRVEAAPPPMPPPKCFGRRALEVRILARRGLDTLVGELTEDAHFEATLSLVWGTGEPYGGKRHVDLGSARVPSMIAASWGGACCFFGAAPRGCAVRIDVYKNSTWVAETVAVCFENDEPQWLSLQDDDELLVTPALLVMATSCESTGDAATDEWMCVDKALDASPWPCYSTRRARRTPNVVRIMVARAETSLPFKKLAVKVNDTRTTESATGLWLERLTVPLIGSEIGVEGELEIAMVDVLKGANGRGAGERFLGKTIVPVSHIDTSAWCLLELSPKVSVRLAMKLEYDETRDNSESRPFFEEVTSHCPNVVRVAVARVDCIRGTKCGAQVVVDTKARQLVRRTATAPSVYGVAVIDECFEFKLDAIVALRVVVSIAGKKKVKTACITLDPREESCGWHSLESGARVLVVVSPAYEPVPVDPQAQAQVLQLAFPNAAHVARTVTAARGDVSRAATFLGTPKLEPQGPKDDDYLRAVNDANDTDLDWLFADADEDDTSPIIKCRSSSEFSYNGSSSSYDEMSDSRMVSSVDDPMTLIRMQPVCTLKVTMTRSSGSRLRVRTRLPVAASTATKIEIDAYRTPRDFVALRSALLRDCPPDTTIPDLPEWIFQTLAIHTGTTQTTKKTKNGDPSSCIANNAVVARVTSARMSAWLTAVLTAVTKSAEALVMRFLASKGQCFVYHGTSKPTKRAPKLSALRGPKKT